jgi:hypothetical protein
MKSKKMSKEKIVGTALIIIGLVLNSLQLNFLLRVYCRCPLRDGNRIAVLNLKF